MMHPFRGWKVGPKRQSLRKTFLFQMFERHASDVCSATKICTLGLVFAAALACSGTRFHVTDFPSPSAHERYCAWYGEVQQGTLFFGQAPFWSTMRASGGEPLGDLSQAGPQQIGRFDLSQLEPLPPLDVTAPGARSGVWDVLPRSRGEVFFTTFYEAAGAVNTETGRVRRFEELGLGLNELAAGPEDALLATRYGAGGSLVLFSPGGLLLAEYPLRASTGSLLAPKTPAWDEESDRYWVTTDRIGLEPGGERPGAAHPTVVLDAQGHEIARIEDVEVQFVRFDPAGRGVAAFVTDSELRLTELAPGPPSAQLRADSGVLLDGDFPAALDFVQDISFGPAGEVILTRWSGHVHIVGGDGQEREVRFPRDDPGELYYSGALSPDGETVCATRCGEVAVVCARVP